MRLILHIRAFKRLLSTDSRMNADLFCIAVVITAIFLMILSLDPIWPDLVHLILTECCSKLSRKDQYPKRDAHLKVFCF